MLPYAAGSDVEDPNVIYVRREEGGERLDLEDFPGRAEIANLEINENVKGLLARTLEHHFDNGKCHTEDADLPALSRDDSVASREPSVDGVLIDGDDTPQRRVVERNDSPS